MARILPPAESVGWFDRFLTEVPANLLEPATVADRADGHLVHLDGLNLSRAWHWRRLANRLPPGDARIEPARAAADRHLAASLPGVQSGEFMGDHWLATLAVLATTDL